MVSFKITSEQGKSRTGKLRTSHGIIETPFFMPVATKAAAKHLTNEELIKSGTEAIITNALLLSLKPGLDIIKHHKGLHKFINWNKIIFTDSGGFQILSKFFLQKTSIQGFHFKSPYNGENLILSPERAIEIQNILNSDVAMCLDDVPHHNSKSIELSLNRTHEWAERCKKAHKNKKQLLFGITQGSIDKELRIKSAKFINNLNFDGIALGGLCIGEPKEIMYKIIDISLPYINKEKPRYLMGVGSPKDLIESVSHGIDLFDSCFPTRIARHGNLFTKEGKIDIKKGIYKKDGKPIDKDCNCPFCKFFTKSYLHHLFTSAVPLAYRYASLHNIYFIQNLMGEIKKSIKQDYFEEFKKEYR